MKHSQGPESQTDSYSGALSNLMTTTAADPLHKIHTLTEFVKVHYNLTSFDFDNCYSNVKASSSPPPISGYKTPVYNSDALVI